MKTDIPAALLDTEQGTRANDIIRACVHCGFCNATCPTYQLLGNELDGPRGRIYLIKEMLEGGEADDATRLHLDRCLTCRACETTCPSGVRYGELLEIGREMVEQQNPHGGVFGGLARKFITQVVPNPRLLEVLVRLGRPFRRALPAKLRRLLKPAPKPAQVPPASRAWDSAAPEVRRVLLLQGCVQRVVTPEVTAHLKALLEARGLSVVLEDEGCCGGLALHLGNTEVALQRARDNVALVEQLEVDRIVSSASGCGVTWKDYGRLLGTAEARAAADRVVDACELLGEFRFAKRDDVHRVAWHPPCTLQHGQKITGLVERILEATGYQLVPVADAHLCCGAAGAYSLLQPKISDALKERKIEHLSASAPDIVATANIGCQTHLDADMSVPVVHWLELLR